MRLIFINGLPATGKLTVGKELARLTGYRLFHNHLVVDLLLSTFEFGSTAFIDLRERIWLEVFEEACRADIEGMIFTFNPERTVREGFAERVTELIMRYGGSVAFVELVCATEELRRRIDGDSRRQYRKLSSLELFDRLKASGEFDAMHMPKPEVRVNTNEMSPSESALRIVESLIARA